MSELRKNIVLSEIKNGRQVFFLETDKKRFFFSAKQTKLILIFDDRSIWSPEIGAKLIRHKQNRHTQNWSKNYGLHINSFLRQVIPHLGKNFLLAQNNDLDSPLFVGVKKRRALGYISSKSKFQCLQTCKHWNLDFVQMYPMARNLFLSQIFTKFLINSTRKTFQEKCFCHRVT